MSAIEPALIEKLQKLPPQRHAEVRDFVEILVAREERAAATFARWGQGAAFRVLQQRYVVGGVARCVVA